MTPDEAKLLMPIMSAFAEGKTIQKRIHDIHWEETTDLVFIDRPENYRVKPETNELLTIPDFYIITHKKVLTCADILSVCEPSLFIPFRTFHYRKFACTEVFS